ncbi:MAG: aminotransferase class V-fold PLP-dependent enzyme [Alphaproteobacteria bacterium]
MPDTPIYLDNHATTPLDPRVLDAMLPYLREHFGNPGSVQHAFGRSAATAVEAARADVAALIGAEPREIVFTSGATESNNLAIKGAARFRRGERSRIVTLATEHKCVLESARALERDGFSVTILDVARDGLVDLDSLDRAVDARTALVSVMAAQNEIGVLQPLDKISAICRARGAWLHTDAAQAVGKVSIDVAAQGIDLLSISGHKLYGPKGIGALYVRRRPRVRLEPLFDGGGQERGFRSGTLAPALCVGLGSACAIAGAEMAAEAARLRSLRDRLWQALSAARPDLAINGNPDRRLPGNLNLRLPGIDANKLMAALPDIAISSGSACMAAEIEPSYVLRALGLSDAEAASSVRIGLGRFTTAAEIDRAAKRLIEAARAQAKDAAQVSGRAGER